MEFAEEIESQRLNMRMTESPPDKEMLRFEIIRKKKKKKDYYRHLANTLDYKEIREMTNLAVEYKNLEAIMGLLETNVYAATDALDTEEGIKFFMEKAESSGLMMPEIYFFIRRPISEKYKGIFRRLARQSIIKLSLKITSKGIRGNYQKTVPFYIIGMPEFNLDETIQQNPLKIYKKSLSHKDIYGIKRQRKKRNIIMILDSSGSMYGRLLLNAALTTSVLAYNMEKENYGIVLFNSNAMLMKKINEIKPISNTIDDILDSEAVGFTNIHLGLEKGLKELQKLKTSKREKIGILISDGNYNRGENPVEIAKRFPKLHVIGMPADNDAERGIDTCRDIAKAGHGKFISVQDYKEIPRALMDLLSQT